MSISNRDKYPVDWEDTIRPAALKRSNYRCVDCGAKHRSKGYRDARKVFIECDTFQLTWAKANNKKIITIYLQISHDDNNVNNNTDLNLRARCPRCHFKHDAVFNKLRKLAKIHLNVPGNTCALAIDLLKAAVHVPKTKNF